MIGIRRGEIGGEHERRNERRGRGTMTRRDEILQVICEYTRDHHGNTPSEGDLVDEMKLRGHPLSKGTIQVHLNKLRAEGRLYSIDGYMVVTGARWRHVDADGVIHETLADRAIHDPLSFTATVAPARRRIHKMRQRHGIEAQSADIQALLTSQRFRCWWCGALVSDDYHVDHRVPLSRGGTNDVGNLCITCPSCNLHKSDKMPWEFNGRLV